MKIGQIIKYYRLRKNLTQEQLSNGICSVPYLSKVENGKLNPSNDILIHLYRRLNIDSDYVLAINDSEIQKELNEWYHTIRRRMYSRSHDLKESLDAKLDYMTNLHLVIDYEIYSVYYYLRIKDVQKAIELFDKLNETRFNLFNDKQIYYFKKVHGILLSAENKRKLATQVFEETLRKGLELGIKEPDVYYSLSILYSRIGKIVTSTNFIEEAYILFQKELDFKRILDCTMILGINHLLLKEYELAKEYFITLMEHQDIDNEMKAKVLHNLGVVYFKQAEFTDSIKYLLESLQLREDTFRKLKSYYILSQVYITQREEAQFNQYICEGVSLAEDLKNNEYAYKFALLKHEIKPTMSSIEYIRFLEISVLPYFKEYCDEDDFKGAVKLLGNEYYRNKYYKKAADVYLTLI